MNPGRIRVSILLLLSAAGTVRQGQTTQSSFSEPNSLLKKLKNLSFESSVLNFRLPLCDV